MADSIESSIRQVIRDPPEQPNTLIGNSSIELLHIAFGSTLTLLLTLVGFKYQGSATTLFREHSLVISLFIVDILVYILAFVNVAITIKSTTTSTSTSTSTIISESTEVTYKYIFLISGSLGCEFLLSILVSLGQLFVINTFVLLFFEVLRRWHNKINELIVTVTSSMVVPAINHLIHNVFRPLCSNGFWMLARLYFFGQEVFALYPLFNTSGIRAEQDDQEVGFRNNIFCNNVFHSAPYGEDFWCLRIYNSGLSFSSTGNTRTIENEAGGAVEMTHMV